MLIQVQVDNINVSVLKCSHVLMDKPHQQFDIYIYITPKYIYLCIQRQFALTNHNGVSWFSLVCKTHMDHSTTSLYLYL